MFTVYLNDFSFIYDRVCDGERKGKAQKSSPGWRINYTEMMIYVIDAHQRFENVSCIDAR